MNFDIFNISGKKVLSERQINSNKYSINLEHLQKGIYFIKLVIGDITYSRKYIID